MDKFLDNWLPNIVVNAVFYLIQHAREVAAVTGLAYAASRLHKVFAARKASSGELTFDASTGSLRGVAISNSTAVAHLTTNPLPSPRPHLPYPLWDSDVETHRAVQENLRIQRNYTAPFFSRNASTDVLGSPLLDDPR
jgi:hypothetical protein